MQPGNRRLNLAGIKLEVHSPGLQIITTVNRDRKQSGQVVSGEQRRHESY